MIINADILEWAASYDGPLFHALLCDAPYHLTEITARFGGGDAAPAQYGRDGAFQRMSKGFMGKSWDGVDENGVGIAFNPETWRLIARCLHPGAFLFVFAGTINDDLISVAMRQAGLRKYHKSMAWGYGQGFPKATNLPAQIDEHAFRQWLATHDEERIILDRFRAKVLECRQSHKVHQSPTGRALVTAAHNAYRQKRQEIKAAAGFLKTSGTRRHQPKFDAAGFAYREKDNGYNSKERETFDVTVPATDLAQAWDGYSYGGQMIKPALETLLIFEKPYDGAPVDCITRTGAGALWIDGARIGTDDEWQPSTRRPSDSIGTFKTDERTTEQHPAGRWPANLLLSHHPDCEPIGTRRVRGSHKPGSGDYPAPNGYEGGWSERLPSQHYADADGMETIAAWRCHPECPVLALGTQSGESESKRSMRGEMNVGCLAGITDTGPTPRDGTNSQRGHDDSGTAARFFFHADYMYERLEAADPLFYCAKADRAEREAGLDPRQTALLGMEEVEGDDSDRKISASGHGKTISRCAEHGMPISIGSVYECGCPIEHIPRGTINDGRQKSIDNPYQRGETPRRNIHPTIKPLSLCRYLATLLLPPALYAPRRLLVPFCGAASEYIGGLLAGWEEIVGIEIEADYCRIGEARAAYWRQRRHEFLDPSKPIEAKVSAAPPGQRDMFLEDL